MQLQVIDLSREQERSKQAEARKAEAEAQRAAQSYAIVSPTLGLQTSESGSPGRCSSMFLLLALSAPALTSVELGSTWGTRPCSVPPQEREKVHWEEQRKAMQADMHNKAELARFEDELARKRAEVEHEKQRARQVELVR